MFKQQIDLLHKKAELFYNYEVVKASRNEFFILQNKLYAKY